MAQRMDNDRANSQHSPNGHQASVRAMLDLENSVLQTLIMDGHKFLRATEDVRLIISKLDDLRFVLWVQTAGCFIAVFLLITLLLHISKQLLSPTNRVYRRNSQRDAVLSAQTTQMTSDVKSPPSPGHPPTTPLMSTVTSPNSLRVPRCSVNGTPVLPQKEGDSDTKHRRQSFHRMGSQMSSQRDRTDDEQFPQLDVDVSKLFTSQSSNDQVADGPPPERVHQPSA